MSEELSRPVYEYIDRPRPQLPDIGVRAFRQYVLVLVEPMQEMLKSGLIVVKGQYDEHTDPGFGYVLSADKYYWHLPPDDMRKAPHTEDLDFKYQVPVKKGDKILFRRFVATQRLMQGKVPLPENLEKAGYVTCFLHVHDIMGVIEDD